MSRLGLLRILARSIVAAVLLLALMTIAFWGPGMAGAACQGRGAVGPVDFLNFHSSFESRDFREWRGYGSMYQPEEYPPAQIIDPHTEGVPRRRGCRVARLRVTRADAEAGRVHAKLIRSWHVGSGPPPDVTASYRAWYYLPKRYRVRPLGWVNIFQWKEPYRCSRGYCSDPSWWIVLESGRGGAPEARLNNWRGYESRQRVPFPRGRWVQVRADLRQGRSIKFFIDGRYFLTAHHRRYPVGPMHGNRSLEWGFGVGNYAGHGSGPRARATSGPMYVDDVSIRRLTEE